MVALSFVRSSTDAELVHEVMDRVGRRVPVIAKLEKPQAIENLERIVLTFDAIMVARGDLAVELPLEEVPLVQKHAVQIARENAKPVTKRGVISYAARDIGERPEAKALVAFTQSGDTARRLARLHARLPLLAFTPTQ